MRLLVVLLAAAAGASAAERWVEYRSGPFEVYTNAGAKAGRSALLRFEQFRHAVGEVIGEPDLGTPMPVRILVFRKQDRRTPSEAVLTGRDRYAIVLPDGAAPPPAMQRGLAALLVESNTARMPAEFERGVAELFSTLEVEGLRITLGQPPPARSRDWARAHLLATSPEYYGKLRVILSNLRGGVPAEVAYRNAVARSPVEIERETDRYFAAGAFPAVRVSSRPMAERDFEERPVEPARARLALADLLLADAPAAYQAMIRENINVPESWEGLGLLALAGGRREEARKAFGAAIQAGSKSARCHLEYARVETDNAAALKALEQAARLNPKLAEPHYLAAQREQDLARRVEKLKTAAELDPRKMAYWEELARAYLQQGDFGGAAKAWTSAEQAATRDEDRARMKEARGAIERQRLDYEEAERKRLAEEKERELEELKARARAEVRALEERFNKDAPPRKPGEEVVPWWDDPAPTGRARGNLTQVDCQGRQAVLVILNEDGTTIRLLAPDLAKLAIRGAGRPPGCGAQKPRRVLVEYFPKANAPMGAAGEAATLEYQ